MVIIKELWIKVLWFVLVNSDARIHRHFKESIIVRFRITLCELPVEIPDNPKAIEVIAFSLGALPELHGNNPLQKGLHTWPRTAGAPTGTKLEALCLMSSPSLQSLRRCCWGYMGRKLLNGPMPTVSWLVGANQHLSDWVLLNSKREMYTWYSKHDQKHLTMKVTSSVGRIYCLLLF